MGRGIALDLYAAGLLAAAILALFLGAFAWPGARRGRARSFAFLQFLIFAWNFAMLLEVLEDEPATQFLFLRLQYAAIVFVPVAAFGFGRAMADRPGLPPRLFLALLPLPLLSLGLVWSPLATPWFWADAGLGARPLVNPRPGPLFVLHVAYSWVLVSLCFAYLGSRIRRSKGAVRRWFAHIAAVLALPFAANIAYVLVLMDRGGLDPTPVTFALSGALISVTLRRYNLFDAVPFAKEEVFASFADPMLSVDAEGYVAGANAEAEELFGARANGLEGLRLRELCPRAAEALSAASPARDGAAPGILERGGRSFEPIVYRVGLRRGRWAGGIVVLRDATEREASRRALEAREEAERLYDFMVNASRDIMSIINRELRYEAVNEAFCEASGRPRAAVIGLGVREFWGEETSRRGIEPALESCFRGERVVVRRRFAFGPIGEERDLEVSYNPFVSSAGIVTHAVVVTKDVSDYIAAQRELARAREVAEEANRSKSAFLAAMSHEIRTPLNAVIGLTELVLDGELTPGQREDLSTVLSAGRSLLGVINDILDLSRAEAGRMSLESIAFDPRARAREVLRTYRLAAESKGLELALEIAGDCPRAVLGDPLRFGQVLTNLLGNALKFTESGGILVTMAREAAPPGELRREGLRVGVRDSGIGIEADKLDLIFESFAQADASVTRRYGGSGLGLAISKGIVALLGGRMEVVSRPGEGSTFSFTAFFEAADEAAIEVSGDTAAGAPPSPPSRVLVVEDNPVNARVAVKWLDRAGHASLHVESGPAALAALRAAETAGEPFDLALLDVEMPGMDGYETARRIRAGEGGDLARALPLVALTAHSGEESRSAARAAGMEGFVPKPVDFRSLAEAIARLSGPPRSAPRSSEPTPPGPPRDEALLDEESALRRLGGDRELLAELLGIFAADAPARSRELATALAAREAGEAGAEEALRRAAHAIRGSAANLAAAPLVAAAAALENACSAGEAAAGASRGGAAGAENLVELAGRTSLLLDRTARAAAAAAGSAGG